MPYIASKPESFKDQVVGDGQCVAYVKAASGAPATSQWKEGAKVKGASLAKGTAIATFVNGKYPNNESGQHAAIYIKQDAAGIEVWDQWKGQAVHTRKIAFKGGNGSLSNDGDAFSVIL